MQFQKPALVQKQELRLSPQLLQSIQILALPLIELRTRIQEELEVNPALEVIDERNSLSLDELPKVKKEDYGDYTESYDSSLNFEGYDDEAGDNKRRFMEQALARPESLQEHLLWQLRLHPMPEQFFQIGELLIRNLDENGFHREDPTLLVAEDQLGAMQKVMDIIRSFEPVGTCVADYKESLKVQARQYAYVPQQIDEIIDKHLEAMDKGKFKEIAKVLGLSEDDVAEALLFIQQLTPFPGRLYSNEKPHFVIPDLQVTRREDQFYIILNDEEIPVLGIDPFFDQISHKDKTEGTKRDKKQTADAQSFVQSKLKDARWFINSIRMRNETLLKVASSLVEFQKEFFLHGPRAIVPLTLRDIANEIGVHETTVSRLTNGKYVQTDWGLYELKYFFSSALSGTAGEVFSKEGVKQILKELLATEENKGLSDQKISELLEKRGIKIARRTVTKYRKELDIDSSYDR